jgi:hypothetical protein
VDEVLNQGVFGEVHLTDVVNIIQAGASEAVMDLLDRRSAFKPNGVMLSYTIGGDSDRAYDFVRARYNFQPGKACFNAVVGTHPNHLAFWWAKVIPQLAKKPVIDYSTLRFVICQRNFTFVFQRLVGEGFTIDVDGLHRFSKELNDDPGWNPLRAHLKAALSARAVAKAKATRERNDRIEELTGVRPAGKRARIK